MPLPSNVVADFVRMYRHVASQEYIDDLWKYIAKRQSETESEALDFSTSPERREVLVHQLEVWREVAGMPEQAFKQHKQTAPDKQDAPAKER